LRELLPGTWYAKDGSIHIKNPDGTYDILQTSWDSERRSREALKKYLQAEAIKQNQAEKRKPLKTEY
jgi:hypothetical protein